MIGILLALGTAASLQGGNEELRKVLKDADLVGNWIYDDLNGGYAEAKKGGKPMLVVFR